MSGQRRNVVGSKRPREVFLTSSSLSFSSLSSSCASSDDDAIEISVKTSRTSYEDHKGKNMKGYSPGSEISCVQQPSPSSPSRLRPVRLMDECLGTHYDPERIPASVFAKTRDANLTNDSLFSLRMSTCQAFRQSDVEPEEVLMSGDFLAYSPSLLVKTEEAEEEKRSQAKETKSAVTKTHQEKSSLSTLPAVSWSNTNYPSSFYQLYHAPQTKAQSCPLHVGEKKSKKRKETRKSKKRKEKLIWCWFSSGFLKCNLHCCGRSRELKAIVM